MKRNHLITAVVVLWVFAALTAMSLPGTLARYSARVSGDSGVQIAKFAFEVGSTKTQTKTTGPFNDIRPYWEQVAVNTVATFELPLFDSEYWNPAGNAVTVLGRKTGVAGDGKDIRDIVVAPGTGSVAGNFKNNENRGAAVAQHTPGGGWDTAESIFITVKNSSDVTVRFKMNAVGSYAPLKILAPLAGETDWSTQDATLTWNDKAWDMSLYGGTIPPIADELLLLEEGNRWEESGKTPWSSSDVFWGSGQRRFIPDDPWVVLEPDEEFTFGITWLWDFGIFWGSPASDEVDTYFGNLASWYLAGQTVKLNAADPPRFEPSTADGSRLLTPDEVSLTMTVKLTVEQVD